MRSLVAPSRPSPVFLLAGMLTALAATGPLAGPAGASGGIRQRCVHSRATMTGTVGADVLVGTRRDDVIVAGPGADVVLGRGGGDTICGGSGDDYLASGGGVDQFVL